MLSELITTKKKDALRKILFRLHAGESPEVLKEAFRDLLDNVTPLEISQIEAELIKDGTPREELERLCDVHMTLFKESLDKGLSVPAWHPINILIEEHKRMLGAAERAWNLAKDGPQSGEELRTISGELAESETHYAREENVLFPYLEKHGITEPPAIMWMEHDRIRAERKAVIALIEDGAAGKLLAAKGQGLYDILSSHFRKEEKILFPSALEVISESEWKLIRKEFDKIGYTSFTPTVPTGPSLDEGTQDEEAEGEIRFTAGALSLRELAALLDSLPIDITFIDKDDTVRYFNQAPGRIFVRSPAIIGRMVQNCHPQKSVHVVNRILKGFKSGKRDEAAFWINMAGKTVYIRYFPVRDKAGEYLGTLEVTQDITQIRSIEGEKRLLDEETNPKEDENG